MPRRRNIKANTPPTDLYSAEEVAKFLGISLNALYLRMHFGNFPEATKINGRLHFKMEDILAYLRHDDEAKAFAWLVRDEVRSLIDLGHLSRREVGMMIGAAKPLVGGGSVYLRPISLERAFLLYENLKESAHKLHITMELSFIKQYQERATYIRMIWERLIELGGTGHFARAVNRSHWRRVAKSIDNIGPSWRVAKILHLALLKEGKM
ncbi:MAG: helix-turn-helix domain-containing protein [Campylobacterales bacterium]